MRAFSVFLLFAAFAAAQQRVSICNGGTLVAVEGDAIRVEMNRKTERIHTTAATEIWRRGVDLDSPAKLVPGEQIYAQCQEQAADGAPIATLIAAVQGEDAMYMEPHHVHAIRPCGGILIGAAPGSFTVRDDKKVTTVRLEPQPEIWRGQIFHDTGVLHVGDEIDAACEVHYPGESLSTKEVWANLTATEGVIVKVLPNRIIVDQYPGSDRHSAYPRGKTTILLDSRTGFQDGTRADLHAGLHVRVIGLEARPGKQSGFLATRILIYR